MTTVSTIEDIIRAMRERPEVRDAIRREVLVGQYWWKQLDKKRGSRPRCVLLMDGSREDVAERLTNLVDIEGVCVSPDDEWMPYGKPVLTEDGSLDLRPTEEARLDKPNEFVGPDVRQSLREWWLAVYSGNTQTPNWDVASTCTIRGKKGLLLVEAKAHSNELSESGKSTPTSTSSINNHNQIGLAIAEASAGLECASGTPWTISHDSHYQLSNRFAWSWKLASLDVPVVLLYLGFLNACDMSDQGCIFLSRADWERTLKSHSQGVVPEACWGKWLDISGTPMIPIIRAFDQPFTRDCAG